MISDNNGFTHMQWDLSMLIVSNYQTFSRFTYLVNLYMFKLPCGGNFDLWKLYFEINICYLHAHIDIYASLMEMLKPYQALIRVTSRKNIDKNTNC